MKKSKYPVAAPIVKAVKKSASIASPSATKSASASASAPASASMSSSESAWDEGSILAIARPSIQVLKPYVPGKSIEEVRAKYNPKTITKLGSNENPLGASGKVITALKNALAGISLYPDGASSELRKALAAINSTKKYSLHADQVMVGNGSDEVLLMIAATFLNPGETVLVSENTFSEYEFSGRMLAGKIVKVPLKDMRYDLQGFQKQLKLKPKLIFLCNPNNPTGSYFTHAELEKLLIATSGKTLVIVDEAYSEYSTAKDFPQSIELLKKFPNLIISRTFSKIYGMAGLRLGYAFADSLLIRETSRVKTPFNVNRLVQSAAVTALLDKEFREKSIRNNTLGREFLYAEFKKRGIEFIPTEANFICFRTDKQAVDFCEDLLKQGMIIRALRSFGLDYWNRVTIGTPKQNKEFLRALDLVLK